MQTRDGEALSKVDLLTEMATTKKLTAACNTRRCFEPGACFAAGTLVHTKDGLRPIEELKVGDLVLTWPQDMPIPKRARLPDEYIYKPVAKTFVREDTLISAMSRS